MPIYFHHFNFEAHCHDMLSVEIATPFDADGMLMMMMAKVCRPQLVNFGHDADVPMRKGVITSSADC